MKRSARGHVRAGGGLSDESLLVGFGAGDPVPSLAFVQRFQAAMFGLALVVVGDAGLAEDVTQQAFEQVWRHAESYDPRRGPVRGWAMTIVRNLAVDTVRVRRPYPLDHGDLDRLVSAMTDTPENQVLGSELSAQLGAALADLPPEQARLTVMSAVHGFSAAALADLDNIPLGTVKSRIRAGLRTLRDNAPSMGQHR